MARRNQDRSLQFSLAAILSMLTVVALILGVGRLLGLRVIGGLAFGVSVVVLFFILHVAAMVPVLALIQFCIKSTNSTRTHRIAQFGAAAKRRHR